MDILKAVILGLVEGATEFLPVSSTAHLLLAEKLLSFEDEAEIFTVVIQIGAICAAGWFFRGDASRLVRGVKSKDPSTYAFITSVILGLLPAIVIGLLVELTVGIPTSTVLIGASLVIGGVILLVTEHIVARRAKQEPRVDYAHITTKRALIIGLAQCLAIVPGVSRSGSTIVAGLLTGVNRATATAYSFYLSIPLLLAASVLKIIKDSDKIASVSGGNLSLIIGLISAFISAFIVVGWLLRYVQHHNFKPFAYYRIVLGSLILLVVAFT
jgi:undecaprenyl-diphosphatase